MLSHFATSWNLLVGLWVVCKNLSNQVIIVKFVHREEESQSEEAYLLNGLFVIYKWKSKSLRPYCSRPIIKQCWSHFVFSLWSCGVYSQLSLRGTTLCPARSALLRDCLHGGGGPQVGEVTRSGGVKDSGGSRGGARPPLPFMSLFLDQTEARRAEKIVSRDRPPLLISGYGWPPNEQRLCEFCDMNELVITGTNFQHKNEHKTRWVSPNRISTNQIDHVLIDKRLRNSVKDTRVNSKWPLSCMRNSEIEVDEPTEGKGRN